MLLLLLLRLAFVARILPVATATARHTTVPAVLLFATASRTTTTAAASTCRRSTSTTAGRIDRHRLHAIR